MDFRGRVSSIRALQIQLGLGSYDKLHRVLSGKRPCPRDLAIRIESATGGAIRAWELLGLQDGPAPVLPGRGEAA